MRTFRSARRSRPKGLHYTDFFTSSQVRRVGATAKGQLCADETNDRRGECRISGRAAGHRVDLAIDELVAYRARLLESDVFGVRVTMVAGLVTMTV